MKSFIRKLKKAFNSKSAYQADLNRYIQKRSPTSTAEVEHLIREFDRKQTQGVHV